MEAALYGICTGTAISSMLLWFSCLRKIMTGDKFAIYVREDNAVDIADNNHGNAVCARFQSGKIAEISNAQKGTGCDVTEGRAAEKLTRHKDNIDNVFLVSGKFCRYGRFHEGERIRNEKTFKFCNI